MNGINYSQGEKIMTTKLDMGFLKAFNKDLEKMDGISTTSAKPRYAFSTGNYVLNKITSGSFYTGGIACQGRVGNISGPSGAGKSFLLANVLREAQSQGAHILMLDSEGAFDEDFTKKINLDSTNNYTYIGVTTFQHVVNIVSQFLKGYKKDYPTVENAPKVVIAIDSLDMLITETENDHYDKGVQKGDQGQRAKTMKHMLRTFVQDIKALNVSMVVTSQVYKSQDVFSGESWVINEAVKYSASTITLVTKLKLKETGSSEVLGIRMKCEGYKVRYTKPFQQVVINVPYEEGLSPTSGLLETGLGLGVIEKRGSRYVISGDEKTWFAKDIDQYVDIILPKCEEVGTDKRLLVNDAD